MVVYFKKRNDFNEHSIKEITAVKKQCIKNPTTIHHSYFTYVTLWSSDIKANTMQVIFKAVGIKLSPIAIFLCSFLDYITFSDNIDFLLIPAENSSSNKIELLLARQDDDNGGVIQVIPKEEFLSQKKLLY